MIDLLPIPAYLMVILSGWGLLGFVYYRVQLKESASRSLYRGLTTMFLGLIIGIWVSDSAAGMSTDSSLGATLLRSVANAWWMVPYLATGIIVLVSRVQKRRRNEANQAL